MEKESQNDLHNISHFEEATRNRIDKHLRDKDDTISEEDLKNITTDTAIDKATNVSEEKKDDNEKTKNQTEGLK